MPDAPVQRPDPERLRELAEVSGARGAQWFELDGLGFYHEEDNRFIAA